MPWGSAHGARDNSWPPLAPHRSAVAKRRQGTVAPGGAGGGAPNDTDNSGSPYANLGGGGGGGYTFSAFPGREGGIVLKIPDTHTASFPDGGVTSATITSVSGFNIYNITAITGTKKIRFTRT